MSTRNRRSGLYLAALLIISAVATSVAGAQSPCSLVTPAELRLVKLPPRDRGVVDSTDANVCRWGDVRKRQALIVKVYPALNPDVVQRMRIGQKNIANPIDEPTVSAGAWSAEQVYGAVLVAAKNGKAVQIRYYLKRQNTVADRDVLRAAAKAVVARL